ncbi:MAG: hypothetical protein AB1546_01570 [bacterium]
MKVFIDNQEMDWAAEKNQTLQDAICEIGKQLLVDEKRLITEIKLGETEPGVDMNLTPDQVTIDQIRTIAFTTESLKEASLREMRLASERFTEMRQNLTLFPSQMMAGEEEIAMDSLKNCVDVLVWFFNLLQQLSFGEIIDLYTFQIEDTDLRIYIEEFNEHLRALVEAMENRDQVLINDYIEYEIHPAVLQLQEIIPSLIDSIESKE